MRASLCIYWVTTERSYERRVVHVPVFPLWVDLRGWRLALRLQPGPSGFDHSFRDVHTFTFFFFFVRERNQLFYVVHLRRFLFGVKLTRNLILYMVRTLGRWCKWSGWLFGTLLQLDVKTRTRPKVHVGVMWRAIILYLLRLCRRDVCCNALRPVSHANVLLTDWWSAMTSLCCHICQKNYIRVNKKLINNDFLGVYFYWMSPIFICTCCL